MYNVRHQIELSKPIIIIYININFSRNWQKCSQARVSNAIYAGEIYLILKIYTIPIEFKYNLICGNITSTKNVILQIFSITILLTKTTAAQNEIALSYLRVRGLYFLTVVFAATIIYMT